MGVRAISKQVTKATLLMLLSGLGGACSHTVSVPAFEPSSVRYPAGVPEVKAHLSDHRPTEPAFSHGDNAIYVEFADESTDELTFFDEALTAELSARGIRADITQSPAPGALRIELRKFQIRNARSSGFSPLVTFATFSADVSNGQKTARVVAYVKNLKMPIWTTSEVDRPCYTNSLRALVGEVASKLNREFVGAVASDAEVARLATDANAQNVDQAIQATYELGFSNNPKAVAILAQLVDSHSEPQRAAALSGLGILGAVDHFERLQAAHEEGKTTSDRYNALEAIGDLGTPEALAYLESARSSANGKESTDIQELVGLYLDARPSAGSALALAAD